MKENAINEPFKSRKGYTITKDHLEGEELQIYDRYLAKLDHPSVDQLRMLATFAWIAVELKESSW